MSKTETSPQKIGDFLSRGVAQVITRESVARKLSSGKALRVKHGVDPSGDELHLGHAAAYLKLRDLQEMGHRIIFLVGGFTGRFGDPTDKTTARSLKSKDEVEANAQTYLKQLKKILDLDLLEVRYNSEWYDEMNAEELLRLMSNFTAGEALERDMFRERKKRNKPIQLHELAYPVLQGYDSVMLKSDLTVIGTDQIFNENFGRELQKKHGQEPQDIVAINILAGLDGEKKMSKSLGNFIAIRTPPVEMFGQIMSLPDVLIIDYFTLLTRRTLAEIGEMARDMANGSVNPKDLKMKLGQDIVSFFHSVPEANSAARSFEKTFSEREVPDDARVVRFKEPRVNLLDLVAGSGLVSSKTEARRLILDGAADVNKETKKDPAEKIEIKNGVVLKVGKHRFVKIVNE